MVAKSGDALLTDDAVATLRDELLPLATVITPNLPEAARLLETVDITDDEQMEAAANDLWKLKGCHGWVYLKGGHMEGVDYSEDLLYDGRHMIRYRAERTMTRTRTAPAVRCLRRWQLFCRLQRIFPWQPEKPSATSHRPSSTPMSFKSEKDTVRCIISTLSGINLQTITPVYG